MFFALLSLVLGLDTNNCVKIKCDGTISPNCMTITASTVSVNSCPLNQVCPDISSVLSTSSSYENLKCSESSQSTVNCGLN